VNCINKWLEVLPRHKGMMGGGGGYLRGAMENDIGKVELQRPNLINFGLQWVLFQPLLSATGRGP